jgi:probable rRNA maturation factor
MRAAPAKTIEPALALDIVIESALWEEQSAAADIIRGAIDAAAAQVKAPAAKPDGEIAILLTDDAAIRVLNRQWRQQDKATNVLSFPSPAAGLNAAHLGDIVIAYETLAREADAEGRPFAHHLAHLAIHGYLHLIGYDHMTDSEAADMEQFETRVLAALGIPDPYALSEPQAGPDRQI